MAKKRAKKVQAIADEKDVIRIRLDLTSEDNLRLEECVKKLGLNKAIFARLAVLQRIKKFEETGEL